jgi:hypothetical protein
MGVDAAIKDHDVASKAAAGDICVSLCPDKPPTQLSLKLRASQ